MNYLEARSELLHKVPRVPLLSIVIEIVALIGIAALMVLFFT
jgi:hypothetical protein